MFFAGVECKASQGVAEGRPVSVGLRDGVSAGATVADEEAVGTGVENGSFRLDFFFGVALGEAVAEAFLLCGDAVADALGTGSLARCFRRFRVGVGVGVGSKVFLIFAPNDSSAASGAATAPKRIVQIIRPQNVVLMVGNNQLASS
jgi:hypothetical protein